jgi:predicted outer membrane repeat protein
MYIKKFILSIGLLLAYAGTTEALTCESRTSGDWDNYLTWNFCDFRTPRRHDTVLIRDDHTVNLNVDTPELNGLRTTLRGGLNVASRSDNPQLGYSINLLSNADSKIDLSNTLIKLSSSLTINARSQDIWLGGVVGPYDIRLNSDGETRLKGKIGERVENLWGSINNPTGLVTDSTGTTVFDIPDGGINSANIQINGDLILNDDVLLAQNTSFLGSYSGGGPITFNGTLNTHSSAGFKWLFFSYLSSSVLQFNKNVGEEKIIKGIEMNNSGGATLKLNLSKFITDSTISLPTKVLLNSPTKTVLIENTTIFDKKIGLGTTYLRTAAGVSPNKLIVKSAAGQVSIRGPVGNNNQPLLSLSMISPTNVVLGGSSITTTLSQDYTGDIKLSNNVVLNSPKIAIQNNVDTAGFDLTLNTTNRSGATKIEGVISGSGDLTKNGIGYLDLYSINTLTGNVIVNEGQLLNSFVKSDSIFPNADQLSIAAGATADLGHVISDNYILGNNQSIMGNGLLASHLITNSGSSVAPRSINGLGPGRLSLDKISMALGSTLSIEINGTTVNSEYDQLVLTQDSSLGGATLDLTLGFNPMIGDTFKIVRSDSPLAGSFAGLPDGAEIISGNFIFNISYVNGSGSDVELTVVDFLILHVDVNAAQGGDGASWSRAFNNLQDALAVASQNSEIWVADGTYYPDVGGGQVDNDRLASFTLVDGVSVYGGFNGTETDLNQRDPETNITILSGDITQDDANSDGNNILEDRLDANGLNSYHIVNGSGVDTSTVFSGFTVTAGQANGTETNERHGAGMYCGLSFNGPSISENTFIGHYAVYDGAATYGCSQDVIDSDFINNFSRNGGAVIIRGGYYENVLFQGNKTYGSGGAISKNASPLKIVNSQFIANQASGNGGAINSVNGVTLENVLFSGNKSNSSGGAIRQRGSSSNLTNVTMTGNLAAGSGGAISLANSVTLNLRNSIIWNNHDSTTDTTVSSSIHVNGATYTQTNSLVQNFPTSGVGNLDVDPLFITNTDPTTAPTALGNARLQYLSMSIDAGDNGFVTLGSMDLDNTDRIFNGTVDMGAYESSSSNTVSVYVSGLGAGSLAVQNKGGDNLTFENNGTQVFMTPVTLTDNYLVTVYSQPTSPSQECVVANPSGIINGSNVNVNIHCTTIQYNVGVDVAGLADGVTLSLLNNAESLDVTSNGLINFATSITDGEGYDVSVVTHPSSPNQECLMTSNNAIGNLNGMDVVVSIECTTVQYKVGVDLSGLADGVALVVMNNSEYLNVESNGLTHFVTAINDSSGYDVSVDTNPSNPNQMCTITSNNAIGNINSMDVIVDIECTTLQYNVGIDVSGLADGVTLVVMNNSETLNVASNDSTNFATAITDGLSYDVSVFSNPSGPNQECLITSNNTSGSINGMDVIVVIECTTLQYNVGVDVSGLASGVTLSLLINAEALDVMNNGQFSFTTALDDGSAYAVTITSQPTNPVQTCFVSGGNSGQDDGSGNIDSADVLISVDCNTALIAVDNIYTAFEDITLVANDADGSVSGVNDDGVLVNDSDVDGDTLMVVSPGIYTATGLGGQIILAADGTFSYVPPVDISGQDVLIFDVTDGVHTVASSLIIDVLPVNDAPTFSILGNVLSAELHPNIVGTILTIPQFAIDMYAGADDESSQTLQFTPSIFADSNSILDVSGVSISNTGELTLNFTGNIGLAIIRLTLQDDGLQTNGGEDTSVIAEFVVSFSDTLFVDDFEEQQVNKLSSFLDGIQSKTTSIHYPTYDESSHSLNYYGHTLKLGNDYLTPQMMQVINYWIVEVEISNR